MNSKNHIGYLLFKGQQFLNRFKIRSIPIGVICSPADHKNVYGDYNHELLKSTSKIRALAFDRTAISKVEWSVDGNGQWKPMTNAHGPLYEADWDQALNDGKIHRVEVRITNVDGDTKIEQIEFRA